MKTLLSTVCAATIALGAVAPLQAAPLFVPSTTTAESNVIQVQSRNEIRRDRREARRERRAERREMRRDRRQDRREARRDRRDDRRDFRRAVRRGNHWYYNGYRGYRDYRPGYREYDGVWFPLAAFAAGAIISGAVNDSPRVIYRSRGGSAHVEWCYDRYRSYRASDNTFQPYHGPRKQCYSPYS